jgi:CysZ protein
MITLKYHLYALKRSLILLRKKQFFVFFIPGVVIALIFFTYLLTVGAIGNVVELVSYTPWIGSYMGTAVDSVFDWVNSISIFVYQFTLITLLSPFLTVLSQRVETHETGKIFQSNRVKFINDILRTIGVAIVGGFIYFSLFLLWTFLAWIFGLSFLSPIVSAILIAFFTGFNSYDYSLERHAIKIKDSWKFAFSNPSQMILTGLIFTLLLFIPVLGVVIAPVLLTMVGTLNYLKMKEID